MEWEPTKGFKGKWECHDQIHVLGISPRLWWGEQTVEGMNESMETKGLVIQGRDVSGLVEVKMQRNGWIPEMLEH